MAKGRGGVQGLMGDGISVCGRLTGFIGVFMLLFMVVSYFTPDWSTTESLNFGGGLEGVKEATFGLREYCLKTQTASFALPQYTCHEYDDMLSVMLNNGTTGSITTQVLGPNFTSPWICGNDLAAYQRALAVELSENDNQTVTTWVNQTGCDRFAGACDIKFEIIRILLVAGIVAVIAGATYSEKIPFYGGMMLLGLLLALGAVSVWANWADELDSDLEATIGLGIISGAIVFAVIGVILAFCDVARSRGRPSLSEDGIDLFGRMGSLLTVCTWLFLAIAVVMPTWTEVSDLGSFGGLCNDDCLHAECSNIQATFGLVRYCVDTAVELTGNIKKEKVCMFYFEDVQVIGENVSQNAFQRFESVSLESTVQITMGSACVGIISSAFADIFSEKLIPAAILSLITGCAGVATLTVWLSFQTQLSEEVPGKAESSDGVYVLGTAFAAAFFTMLVYGVNACKWYNSERKGSANLKG